MRRRTPASWWRDRRDRRRRRRSDAASDTAECCGDAACEGAGCDCSPGLLSPGLLVPRLLLLQVLALGLLGPGRALRVHGEPRPAGRLEAAVRLYQLRVSGRLGVRCRYRPTCSAYGLLALRRHGALRGTLLTLGRLRRCRPGRPGGADPVPR